MLCGAGPPAGASAAELRAHTDMVAAVKQLDFKALLAGESDAEVLSANGDRAE